MMRIPYLIALLTLVPLLQGIVRAAESESAEAKQWLEKMIQAAQSLNYEGTFVYVQGPNLEAMHIIHDGSQNGERQRMSSLNGSVREVLVAGNYVTCLFSRKRLGFNTISYSNRSPVPVSLPREFDRLEANYQFAMLGDDRIAGMPTRIIAIRPRDKLRFGYQLWLESSSGMVLRSALINEKGEMVEQLMFTNMRLNPQIDTSSLESPPLSPSPSEDAKLSAEPVTDSDWVISHLPPGFTQFMHNRFSRQLTNSHSTEHIVFTDGLATISVFLEPLDSSEPWLKGPSQIGAMNAFGVVIDNSQVVVVGEAPIATIEMIANSIQHSKEVAR